MNEFYEILTGPGLWIAFIIFIGGLILRLIYLFALSREKDRVFYNHMSLSWGLRSIGHWLLPLGSSLLRQQPVFGLGFYAFNICLVGVPIFLCAHNILWDEAFGISLWSMPDKWADVLTVVFMGTVIWPALRYESLIGGCPSGIACQFFLQEVKKPFMLERVDKAAISELNLVSERKPLIFVISAKGRNRYTLNFCKGEAFFKAISKPGV